MLTQDQRHNREQFRARISRSDGDQPTGSTGLPQSAGAKIVAGLRRPSQLIHAHFDQKRNKTRSLSSDSLTDEGNHAFRLLFSPLLVIGYKPKDKRGPLVVKNRRKYDHKLVKKAKEKQGNDTVLYCSSMSLLDYTRKFRFTRLK